MPKTKRVFYAFPAEPASLSETINNAIQTLRGNAHIKRNSIRFNPWTDMNIGGKRLVGTILNNIDKADVFACDLTSPNPNVSFELGYAIGRFKRIWISLDPSVEEAELRYRRFYFGLIGAGYIQYNNSADLMAAFLEDNPTDDLEQTLLGDYYRKPMPRQEYPMLVYVKPPIDTEAVIAVGDALQKTIFRDSIITDDANENPSPTLDWYAGKLGSADAVLCHLLGDQQTGHLEHNVKCALVAGVSKGFQRSMLMLAQHPYKSPIDYQSLLALHETAAECRQAVEKWIGDLKWTPSLGQDRSGIKRESRCSCQ